MCLSSKSKDHPLMMGGGIQCYCWAMIPSWGLNTSLGFWQVETSLELETRSPLAEEENAEPINNLPFYYPDTWYVGSLSNIGMIDECYWVTFTTKSSCTFHY